MISAFSFIHNALIGGYPIIEAIESVQPFVDEIVVVDMQSNDGTRKLLESLSIRIIDGIWDCKAGETLARAHAQHIECENDVIWHFEADEVFDFSLASKIQSKIKFNQAKNISVERIQIEQNFQRVRWYPHWVHRIFPKGSVIKIGETTNKSDCKDMLFIDGEYGYLWDCCNVFRDNWFDRIRQQSELRNNEPLNMLFVPKHINLHNQLKEDDLWYFDNPLWTKKYTPLKIPKILEPLLGQTKYMETK